MLHQNNNGKYLFYTTNWCHLGVSLQTKMPPIKQVLSRTWQNVMQLYNRENQQRIILSTTYQKKTNNMKQNDCWKLYEK